MEGVSTGYLETNVMMHATIGGTTSVIMGGKFKNGAITSAFVYLYNSCGHGNCEESLFAQV
ncbi:MAG: hypothetical protein SWL02_12300 [Pseudomonadota bacterium]|nr:hypothetical protein [Pseudomonadota bacterium]